MLLHEYINFVIIIITMIWTVLYCSGVYYPLRLQHNNMYVAMKVYRNYKYYMQL